MMRNILKRLLNRNTQPSSQQSDVSRVVGAPAQHVQTHVTELPPLPPPLGTNNYIVSYPNSCRYDGSMTAMPQTLGRLGEVQRCWSYASWTAPSHYNLLIGLLPHVIRRGKLVEQEQEEEETKFFDQDKLDLLRSRQIEAVRYLDGVFTHLFDVVPPNTYITVTADHGELFGEQGYFGHGPINHEKVYEVPFVEGKIR